MLITLKYYQTVIYNSLRALDDHSLPTQNLNEPCHKNALSSNQMCFCISFVFVFRHSISFLSQMRHKVIIKLFARSLVAATAAKTRKEWEKKKQSRINTQTIDRPTVEFNEFLIHSCVYWFFFTFFLQWVAKLAGYKSRKNLNVK